MSIGGPHEVLPSHGHQLAVYTSDEQDAVRGSSLHWLTRQRVSLRVLASRRRTIRPEYRKPV